jgi:hypothetical protein
MDTIETTTAKDGIRQGPIRHSVNGAINVKGSIHDDATATKLGLRGGTVAGSVHMDLFGPLLLETFGERWWEVGNLSLYFTNATTDREPVQASLQLPGGNPADAQAQAWVDREDGMRVAEGSAAVGHPEEQSALLAKPLREVAPSELRILANLYPGMPIEAKTAMYSRETFDSHMSRITEPMEMHRDSRWGGPVVPLAGYVNVFHGQALSELRAKITGVVGLFGAIEIRNVNGPLLVGTEYQVGGQVVSLGQSPKTEYFWYEAWADDANGKRIAEQRMQLRFMKASSSLYA